MAWRPHSQFSVDPDNPQATGICGRCGFAFQLNTLSFQNQWAGPSLLNTNLLVCDRCLDKPAPFLKTLVLPPDPTPVLNARPEPYSIDES